MKTYKEIYLKAYGYDQWDFIASEISEDKAVDIHHIDCKGMGGDPTKSKERIENLMAVTRVEHDLYGDVTDFMGMLYEIHYKHMLLHGVKHDKQYMLEQIKKYK